MIRSLIRTSIGIAAIALIPLHASAKEPTAAEDEGNHMERKGGAEERGANADNANHGFDDVSR
jgi:hypothetical protein